MTGRGLLRAVVATLALVAVASAALVGVAAANRSGQNRDAQLQGARQQALAAAASGVPVVLSYDYRHLARDFAAAESELSPRFRAQYQRTTAKVVTPLAAKTQAISTAQTAAAGVVSGTADRMVVLVLVSQTSTSSKAARPRIDLPRVEATMVHIGGRWLIDNMITV